MDFYELHIELLQLFQCLCAAGLMEVDDFVYIKREWVGAQRMVTDKTK